jgi:hypothetical protein
MITGDITKNLFTLYQVQREKLQKRRDKVGKGIKKNFFAEDLHIEEEEDNGPANFFPRMKF